MPPIQCLQRKASKTIPNENDLFNSNINSFGNAVGSVTNRATAMFEVRARFPKNSEEYSILSYRIKCVQLHQQEQIDKTKGIVAKGMPKYWYDWFATKIEEGDDEETIKWKMFQRSIVADKKPYFFQYIYPIEHKKWTKYQKDSETKCLMLFGRELSELLNTQIIGEPENKFIENYYKRLPLGIAPCTINRICWKIENEFKSENMKELELFDYNLLKAPDIEYSDDEYSSIFKIYKNYISDRRKLDSIVHSQKTDDFDRNSMHNLIVTHFKKQCSIVCPDKVKLCNILLDVCYRDSNNSKRFVWEMCGDVIIENLLASHNNLISFPVQDVNGDFEYGGYKFVMKRYNLVEQKLID